MPPVWTCTGCGKMRAKSGADLCPVCWLIDALKTEHRAGDHKETVNASCVDCTRPKTPKRATGTPQRRKARKRPRGPVLDTVTGAPVSEVTREFKNIGSLTGAPGSHRDCNHEPTPGERAKCRRRRDRAARELA